MSEFSLNPIDLHSFAVGVGSTFIAVAMVAMLKGLYYGFPLQSEEFTTVIDVVELIAVGLFMYAFIVALIYVDEWWKARWNDAN